MTAADGGGRERGRQRLLRALAGDRPGPDTGVQLVVGTVGIGKTTFVESVRSAAADAGMATGTGSASAVFGVGPLTPWNDALEELHADPSLRAAGLSWASAPDEPPLARYRAVLHRLDELGAIRPLVLVLEDVHEADSASLDLLRFLSQRTPRSPWLVLATTRPDFDWLAGWRGGVIRLDGLDRDELRELAAGMGESLDEQEADLLRARTEGNPLLARRLIEHGVLDDDLTPSLSSLLRAEVAHIPAAAQPVVDTASVLGTKADRDLVATMLRARDVDPDAAFEAIGEGIAGVVSVDHTLVSFSHPLMRELMQDALPRERRAALHAAAASALTERGADPLSVIRHLRLAPAATHTAATGRLATQATTHALASGALVEAIEHARFAREIIDRHGSPDDRTGAGTRLANALSWAGRIGEAEDVLRGLAARGDDVSPAARRDVVREYVRLRWREEPDASSLHADALAELADRWLGGSDTAADEAVRYAALVQAGEIDGLHPDLLPIADAGVEAAVTAGDPLLEAEAHMMRRRALIAHPERIDARSADSTRALELAARLGDEELVGRAQRHSLSDALARGDRVTALSLIVRYDAAPTVSLRTHTALREAGLATIEGRYDDAHRVLDSAIEELGSLGVEAPSLVFFRTFIALDTGGLPDLLREYEHLIATVADPALRSAFAWTAAATGDVHTASRHLDGIADDLGSAETDHLWPVVVAIGGEAAAAVGHSVCHDLLARIEPFAGQCLLPASSAAPWFGPYDRLIGLLRFRLGDVDGALEALHAGLALTTRMHARPWQARCHLALAAVLGHLGRDDEAGDHEAAGRRIADELGMGDVFLTPCPPAGPATTRPGSASIRTVRFVPTDDGWELERGGELHRLASMAGLAVLHALVREAGTDLHAAQLYGIANGVPGVQSADAGPVLDDAARRAYRDRHAELLEAHAEAEDANDLERAARAQEEIDALERELISAYGLGDRARSIDDPGERARVNVRRSVVRALAAIAEVDGWLADHLDTCVSTGRFCRYDPSPFDPVEWTTG